jgi:NAD(P)H dehydrogenase (quinone)
MTEIIVLYYSRTDHVRQMAQHIALGIESVDGCVCKLRTVPAISSVCEKTEDSIPESGHIYIDTDELAECDGLILGSPTRFGNMAAPLKYFIDQTSTSWLSGSLIGKPAAVFTSTGSLHGGHESTLLSMMIPLLHHGMLMTGIPYSHSELMTTKDGGTPYGASHLAGSNNDRPISDTEAKLCKALGERVAKIAQKLSS